MIDIHSHILPGVDDGAQTETDSIAMAKAAIAEGITKIVASPHHKNRTYVNERADIEKHVTALNGLFKEKDLDLEVIAGQEVRIYGEVLDDLEAGTILPVNDTQYIVIEFPSDTVPNYTEQLFYDMQLAGLIPVIVHPERNRELLANHERMYKLISQGALSQVTAASVVGKFGERIQKFSHQLIEANLTHFVASDAHNTTTRGFCMQEAFDLIGQKFGFDTMQSLLENGEYLITNDNVHRQEPQQIKVKRKKLFGIF